MERLQDVERGRTSDVEDGLACLEREAAREDGALRERALLAIFEEVPGPVERASQRGLTRRSAPRARDEEIERA